MLGGGSGIGLMANQALAVNDAKVCICGRTSKKLAHVTETYNQRISDQIITITVDIGEKNGIANLVDEIKKREKCLCILINDAGISSKTFQTKASSAAEVKANLFNNKDAEIDDWLGEH